MGGARDETEPSGGSGPHFACAAILRLFSSVLGYIDYSPIATGHFFLAAQTAMFL